MAKRIVLETTAHKDGRVLSNETLKRVRVDDESYRDPVDSATFESAEKWLKNNGFTLVQTAMPKVMCGTVTVRRFYEKDEVLNVRKALYSPGEVGHQAFNGIAKSW